MITSITSPEDAITAALVRIGYRRRVNNVYEGSDASRLALDIYGQTRDQLLREKDWDFAQMELPLTLSAGPPPPPWLFQYNYPANCIRIRGIFGSSYLADTNDPLPDLYQRETTVLAGVQAEVILSYTQSAVLIYTGRITNPALWDQGFAEALIDALARRLSPSLASLDVEKIVEPIEAATIGTMSEIHG